MQNAFFLGWYGKSSGKHQRATSFYSALSLTEKKAKFHDSSWIYEDASCL